jgi:hypothetical protein
MGLNPGSVPNLLLNQPYGIERRAIKMSDQERGELAHPVAVCEYREQERRDKADTAIVQAVWRVRAELRKGK